MMSTMKTSYHSALLLLIFSLALPQTASAKKEPNRMKPTTPWAMRYEDDSCALQRQFGEGKDRVVLTLSRFGPGHSFRMTLAGKPLRLRDTDRNLYIQFGAEEEEQHIDYLVGSMAEMPALVVREKVRIGKPVGSGIKADKFGNSKWDEMSDASISHDRYVAADHLAIRIPLKKRIVLETGSLGKPQTAMKTCINDLMTRWGIDVEKHKTLSRPVRASSNPGRWMKPEDYPKDMLRERQPALVNFRLSVDATGKPTDCHIQQTTRPKEFDDAVCDTLIRNGEFKPALDADGNPIASYWRNTVRFALPE